MTDDKLELKEITAKNITDLRVRSKMTQLELGNAISYSDKAISKWERAEAVPDAYVLLALSEIFGVSVDYLLHDHTGEPLPNVNRSRVNHVSITSLAIIAVWTVFAIAYLAVYLAAKFSYPLFFIYATIVSLIMLIVFNSLWGKRSLNMLIIMGLVTMIIVAIYLILLPLGNFWQMLLLIIPALLIVLCCFKLKVKKVTNFFLRR